MNKMKLIAAAAALVAAVPAFAKIEVGDNPELVLAVFDEVNKVSFTKDLGTFGDAFKTKFDGNTAAASLGWDLKADSNWNSFMSLANASNLKWTVYGLDGKGGTAAGQLRLFTTAQSTSANLAKVPTWTNQQFTNGIGAGALGIHVGLVNETGTHKAVADGSSVNIEANGKAYFGKNGSGEFYNSVSPFSNANILGAESEFFLLTRSGANQLGKVLVDRFENLDSKASTFKLDANYVLSANAIAVAVPEPSTYAMLMGGLLALGLVVRRRTNDKR